MKNLILQWRERRSNAGKTLEEVKKKEDFQGGIPSSATQDWVAHHFSREKRRWGEEQKSSQGGKGVPD